MRTCVRDGLSQRKRLLRHAIQSGDPAVTYAAAHDLQTRTGRPLTIDNALAYVLVLSSRDDSYYQRAARRLATKLPFRPDAARLAEAALLLAPPRYPNQPWVSRAALLEAHGQDVLVQVVDEWMERRSMVPR